MPETQNLAPPTKNTDELPDLGPAQPEPPKPPTPKTEPLPQTPAPQITAPPVSTSTIQTDQGENNSGMGSGSDVPPGVDGWGWGPFFFTGIWGIFNNVWISLLAWIPIGPIGIIMAIVLGINGRKWAWQKKKWDSVEQFNEVQRKWSKAGVIIGILFLLAWLAIFFVVFVVALTQPGGIEYNSSY